jgi:hypothetical protein
MQHKPDKVDSKNAYSLITEFQSLYEQRQGADPFCLLRECLDVHTLAQNKGIIDVNDFRLTGYVNSLNSGGVVQ